MSSSSPLKRSFVEADVSLSPVVSEIHPNSDTPLGNELTPVGSQSIGSFIAGVETVDASSNIFLMVKTFCWFFFLSASIVNFARKCLILAINFTNNV